MQELPQLKLILILIINYYSLSQRHSFCVLSTHLSERKHMSAGVAVVFREEFRRLTETFMYIPCYTNGAMIYRLITKPKYKGKLTKLDYHKAFDHLAKDL